MAIAFARRNRAFVTPDRLPLYERMLREGGWWDLVDELSGLSRREAAKWL